jgi:hypothetical protein
LEKGDAQADALSGLQVCRLALVAHITQNWIFYSFISILHVQCLPSCYVKAGNNGVRGAGRSLRVVSDADGAHGDASRHPDGTVPPLNPSQGLKDPDSSDPGGYPLLVFQQDRPRNIPLCGEDDIRNSFGDSKRLTAQFLSKQPPGTSLQFPPTKSQDSRAMADLRPVTPGGLSSGLASWRREGWCLGRARVR